MLAAIAECDERGHTAFLNYHGFSEAKSHILQYEGKQYASKAIAGVAHGYVPNREALRPADFSGGEQTVKLKLENLGFEVRNLSEPNWMRDEVILACDLVRQNHWHWLEPEDPRTEELSQLLQTLPVHPPDTRGTRFRNPNGVARKSVDIATHHPDYHGKPTKGGRVDKEVIADFLAKPEEMQAAARAIRSGAQSGAFHGLASPGENEDNPTGEASEGRLLELQYFARERSSKLRKKKVDSTLKKHGNLSCEICEFNFGASYGERGQGYIECHHAVPLHVSGETTTRLQDLVLLCSNCHRMIHRSNPWLAPDELRAIISENRNSITAGSGH